MTNYEKLREEKMENPKFKQSQIKTMRAKLISTTNARFSYFCGQEGLLALPPLGYSPQFQPDDTSFSILTMSWLVSTKDQHPNRLELHTKNSVYAFEVLDD